MLRSVGHRQLDFRAIKAIGQEYGVDAVMTGQMAVSPVQPSISLNRNTLSSLQAQALVNGSLNAKLLATDTGATV